jgi:hypothetical protein
VLIESRRSSEKIKEQEGRKGGKKERRKRQWERGMGEGGKNMRAKIGFFTVGMRALPRHWTDLISCSGQTYTVTGTIPVP